MLGLGLTTTPGAFPEAPHLCYIARALGPASTAARDGKKLEPVGRQLCQVLWNLIPTLFCPPCGLLAKTEHVSRRSSQDLEVELILVLTYMTLSFSVSEEEWEGRREKEGQIRTKNAMHIIL